MPPSSVSRLFSSHLSSSSISTSIASLPSRSALALRLSGDQARQPQRDCFLRHRPTCTPTPVFRTMSSSSSVLAGSSASPYLPDSLHISQLSVRLPLGVDSWERLTPQPVNIDIQVHTDVSKAGKSDHLPFSIHYGILVKEVEKHCEEAGREGGKRYRSLEALSVSISKTQEMHNWSFR